MLRGLGKRIAPPRFIAFALVLAGGTALAVPRMGWSHGLLIGFDAAALVFLVLLAPLLRPKEGEADTMRARSRENDANRAGLLALTGAVMLVVMAAVALELTGGGADGPDGGTVALVIATLVLAWLFSNIIYALHYAHLYYLPEAKSGKDGGGIDFPGTDEPDYWDFLYFACTLGMTFQTSDTDITAPHMRRVALFHCLAAFIFNLGIIAFSINILGSGGK